MQLENPTYCPIVPPKSPNDQRKYEALTLNNGIKILFIEDPTLQKSACSISVGVGSLQDPDRSLGLAHFLEHMLFMGSKKFPVHNEYSSFINQNSGMDNAYTSDVETNYYFEISNKAFVEAVERITNFFTGALLTEHCISKQTQAVHEEYVLWTNDDNCRKWEILRNLAQGPYSRFSIGNNQTLAHPQIRNDLVKFYETEYSANRINAVLCSSFTIQQMKKQLIPYFEQIFNKSIERPKYGPSFETQNLGKLVRMQSIKQETIMEFFWPVQQLKHVYKKHVDEYITHVLGHEGKNSLFSHLKMKGYASELSCYNHDIANQTIIGLEVKLTELGHQNYEQVYNTVIDYTCSLKPERQIFQEIKQKKQVSFEFKEKTQTYRYVCQLSSKMHDVILQEILNFKYLFEDFDVQFLEKILKQLNPFNVIVVYSNSEELQNATTEKYLGGKYLIENLPQRRVFVNDFKSLIKNPFLPLNTAVKPQNGDKQTPRKISENIVFLKDNSFKVCKGGVKITLHGMKDPVLREFYSEYLELLLKQISYDAQTLQLQIYYGSDDSIDIDVFGFSDTVYKLVQRIGENIISLHKSDVSERYFTISLDKLLEDYENFYCGDVDEICLTTLDNLLRNENTDVDEAIHILEEYTYATETERFLEFLTNCRLSWIFVGNFSDEECRTLASSFESNLKSSSQLQDEQIKCLKLQNSIKHLNVLTSEQISTSGCIVYYEAGVYSERLFYTLQLLKNHVQEPFFNQLRTERQLAYYLTTRIVNTRGVLGMYFILVSSSKDPQYISREIKIFATTFMAKMDTDLTEEKIQQLRQSVKTKFSVPHNNLKALFDFVCQQIQESTFYFNRKSKEQLDKYLKSIQKSELISTWNQISTQSMDIQVLAKTHEEEFNKLGNQNEYLSFRKIKEGNYHNDVISERKTHTF